MLCDTDAAADRTLGEATGVRAVLDWLAQGEHAALAPVSVTGTEVRCGAADATTLAAALTAAGAGSVEAGADEATVALRATEGAWTSRRWVPLATALLVRGDTRLLVGTRALLGEGWNCPQVNCMVDLTSAATSVTVQQMRGRALRLDPGDPDKVASNWSVVCVAPELRKGHADYRRLVRRHEHLHAPAEDGTIERGVSHVHPALSPVAAPPPDVMRQVSRACVARAGAHAEALERWAVGTPFRGVELTALVVRGDVEVPPATPEGRLARPPEPDFGPLAGMRGPRVVPGGRGGGVARPGGRGGGVGRAGVRGGGSPGGWGRASSGAAPAPGGRLAGAVRRGSAWAAGGGALAVAGGVGAALLGLGALAALPAGAAVAGVGWARAGRALETLNEALPTRLDLARSAWAVADALVACGELDAGAAESLTVTPRSDGYLRVLVEDASPEQAATFSAALDEALTVSGTERWVLARYVLAAGADRRPLLAGRPGDLLTVALHPVPEAFARNAANREQFRLATSRWYGPCELVGADARDGPVPQPTGAGLVLRRRVVWE